MPTTASVTQIRAEFDEIARMSDGLKPGGTMLVVDLCERRERVLPGARVRGHLLWRYSIAWTKPA